MIGQAVLQLKSDRRDYVYMCVQYERRVNLYLESRSFGKLQVCSNFKLLTLRGYVNIYRILCR